MTLSSPAGSPSELAQDISQPFTDRPTFAQVAQQTLEQAIKAKYPSLDIDLSKTQLAVPDATARGWRFQPFMPLVLDYLALGTPIDFSSRRNLDCYLSDSVPSRLRAGNEKPDIKIIETLLLELPWTVPINLEDALIRYWNADSGANTATPSSRWQSLSDTLKNILHIQGLQQPGLTEPAREALDQIVRWPDRALRFSRNTPPVYAYSLESTLTQGTSSTTLPSSDVLLLHYTRDGLVILLCSPGSAVQTFESMEAFIRHWGEEIASRYVVDTVTCQRYEISGNAFDTQAAMILEQQLADLKAVQLPARIGLQDLKALYEALSDPSRYLLDAPRLAPETSTRLMPLLPDWLHQASPVDQARFQRYSLALASVKKRDQGRTQLSDIKTFTAEALLAQMNKTNDDSPAKAHPNQFRPDDVELTFTVSAGYPGTAGISEKRTMNLTRLAIDNLVARPSGHLKLSHRQGLALPAWLTPDFITRKNGLIEQVDIGTTYPRYLQQELLSDSPQALQYQRMFAEQVPAQLPLEALQQALDHKNGMTRQGLRLIEALLQPDAEGRKADGHPTVIRHLALLRKPQARPDVVSNMFIVEALDVQTGPHLLYRPLYAPVLMEFPTRQALLQAAGKAGDLQDSILTWLSDDARPVYANGGFQQPHIVRFFQGDEFDVPEKPTPATLATDGVNDELLQYLHKGELMQYLYGCNARALVTQANRDSVSNHESRWAVFLQGGSLLFNTLLFPLLRGPAMAVAWLLNLMASASQDIPALNSEDPATRELAAVDLLVNLAMLVGQLHAVRAPSRPLVPASIKDKAMRAPAQRVIAEQWPAPKRPDMLEGPVALPGEQPEAASRTLDLSFANARHELTPEQLTRLLRMQVTRPASLPEPIKNGPFTGLYVIDNKWHALVDDHLYRVDTEVDGSATVIDPLAPSARGPLLKSDSRGNWSMDLRLRLRGGMPGNRIKEMQRQNAERAAELSLELLAYNAQRAGRQKVLDEALAAMTASLVDRAQSEAQRVSIRGATYKLLEEHIARHSKLLENIPDYARLHLDPPSELINFWMRRVVIDTRSAFLIVEMDAQALYDRYPEFTQGASSFSAIRNDEPKYKQYLDALSDINDRAIHWQELTDHYLLALLDRNDAGALEYERLTANRPFDERSALTTKSLQLPVLGALVFKDMGGAIHSDLNSIITPLVRQVRSHSDLRLYDLTASENLEVLNTLTEQYGKALDALQGVRALNSAEYEASYFDRLLALVESLYQDASKRLAAEIKPEPKPRKRPPKRPKAMTGRPQKKVINTRKNGVLIGDLKPADENTPIDTVELRSEIDDQILVTYSQHDDAWDVIEVQRPIPTPQTRSIKVIKRDARKLLDQLHERLRNAESYTKRCRYPQEIEEIMKNEADRYRRLSEELDRAFAASKTSPTTAEQTLSNQLSDAVTSLVNHGSALRTELSLRLPPTNSNLQYLFEKNLIQVARLGKREALKGPRQDFLQEYAVNDRDGFPIWYAHFHYETADTPKADYSVAHLKTKAQRKEHYHSLLAKAANPYAVLDVHRGQIGKLLARTRFLPLSP
jgi:hypothetical protein